MNRWRAIGLGLAAVVFPVSGWSQVPPPSEPLLKRAPANAEWTIYTYEDRSKILEEIEKQGLKAEPSGEVSEIGKVQPVAVTISKDGKTYREVAQWLDGRVREKWIAGDVQFYETAYGKKIARVSQPASDNFSDYRRSDFEELEWVGKDNYKGVKEVRGRKVYEFQVDLNKKRLSPREAALLIDVDAPQTGADDGTPVAAPAPRIYTAYFDTATQMPLFFDDGMAVRLYKFSARPPGKLVIPPPFAEEFERAKGGSNTKRVMARP